MLVVEKKGGGGPLDPFPKSAHGLTGLWTGPLSISITSSCFTRLDHEGTEGKPEVKSISLSSQEKETKILYKLYIKSADEHKSRRRSYPSQESYSQYTPGDRSGFGVP